MAVIEIPLHQEICDELMGCKRKMVPTLADSPASKKAPRIGRGSNKSKDYLADWAHSVLISLL